MYTAVYDRSSYHITDIRRYHMSDVSRYHIYYLHITSEVRFEPQVEEKSLNSCTGTKVRPRVYVLNIQGCIILVYIIHPCKYYSTIVPTMT